ncbi:MAG: LysR family transcriptional regulator [Lachnospiraceae bacterium]|nr:LysR family transcriptional regulator [Lachnospiraceae bacterium]
MELRTLHYFVTVAEELNITKAAQILRISQPPLSAQIKNLEDELGTPLFIRGKRRLTLTDAGQLLYQRAKDILNLSEKASSEISALSRGMSGTVSIGLVEGMAPDIAAEWFAGFLALHPGVRFRILDGNSDDLIEKMRGGLIGLAVITAPYDQQLLNSFHVGQEKMVALMNRSHPLAGCGKTVLDVEDLKNEPLIVPSRKAHIEEIRRWFLSVQAAPDIICEMDNYLDAAALAGRGIGISIFPQTAYIMNDSLVSREIAGPDKDVEYLFVWRKGHPLPTVEERFIDYVKERYRQEK